MFEENVNSSRIDSLTVDKVTFSACKNTIASMTKKLGHAPALHNSSQTVDTGVAHIVKLINQGYKLVKP